MVALLSFTSCQGWEDPTADLSTRPLAHLDALSQVETQLEDISSFSVRRQVDSLLVWTVLLKNYAEEAALEYAREATRIATENNLGEDQAMGRYYMSLLEGRQQLYREGLADPLMNARVSQSLWEEEENPWWLANVYFLLGDMFYRQNKYDSSHVYYDKTWEQLTFLEQTNDNQVSLRGSVLQGKGLLAYEDDNYPLADSFYHEALAFYLAAADDNALFSLRHAQALVYRKSGLQDSALLILNATLEETRKNGNVYMEVVTLQMLGEQYLTSCSSSQSQDDFEKSCQFFRQGLTLQTDNFFYTHRRLGYLMQLRTAWADERYDYIDSALVQYKYAFEFAREEGALQYFNGLSQSITQLCDWLRDNEDRDCEELLGKPASKYLFTNYSGVVDIITEDLTTANTNFQAFERQRQELESQIRARNIWTTAGSALLFLGLVFLLLYQQQKQKRLQARMEALRAQINPHFFSNSLNAIESLVNLDQRKAASKYLIHFSRLTRRVLNSSMESSTTLAGELETTKHFLALEQLRFKDKLHYEIEIADDVNPALVELPSLIFQPYLENAIWHGIKPKEEPSILKIKISKEGKELCCMIEDDGIGRVAAREQQNNTVLQKKSVGMQITKERLLSFGGGQVEVVDLYNENGTAKGTRVILRLPYKTFKK